MKIGFGINPNAGKILNPCGCSKYQAYLDNEEDEGNINLDCKKYEGTTIIEVYSEIGNAIDE